MHDTATARSVGRPLVDVRVRGWYNPQLDYKHYMVPGILVALVTIIGTLMSAQNIAREKELGTLEQLNVTPITRGEFIAAKLLPLWLLGMINLALGLAVGKLVFDIPMRGSVLLLFGAAAIYLLVALAIGLLVSTMVDTQQQAMFVTFFIMNVYLLLSGLFTPIDSMARWVQVVSQINPVRHFVTIARAILVKGAGLAEIAQPLAILADYVTTYVERDVHQLKGISDLRSFRTFLGLAAGRTAQELNFSSLGADSGVSYNTAKSWVGVLEASFLVVAAQGWHRNLRKQIVKAAKLHFLDTGILCSLLGIRAPGQLRTHPLRGSIFESWVAGELVKARWNRGLPADLKHFRESRGLEIDILLEDGLTLHAIECKSGATVHPSFLEPLLRFSALLEGRRPETSVRPALVYGGTASSPRRKVPSYGWTDVEKLGRTIAGGG